MSANVASREELFRRASAGATFLDSADPQWFERIKLDYLKMSHSGMEPEGGENLFGCILCQLSEPHSDGCRYYSFGVSKFEISTNDEVNFGFYSGKHVDAANAEYAILDEAWREEVLKRRGNCSSPQA